VAKDKQVAIMIRTNLKAKDMPACPFNCWIHDELDDDLKLVGMIFNFVGEPKEGPTIKRIENYIFQFFTNFTVWDKIWGIDFDDDFWEDRDRIESRLA
jgi:hypothetical protein